MASFKFWDDCVGPQDMEAMWSYPEVTNEWLEAGECKDKKVHLSRDPDGQPYLTQTEMRAVVDIVIHRHFDSRMDINMICALAELESDRQPLARRYDKKIKEWTVGIMQLLPKTAEWIASELGYQSYEIQGKAEMLVRPFVSIYFGAAYLKWLSHFEQKERSEEFVVRAYKGGTKKASHKSTLAYWKRYLSVKESLPCRKLSNNSQMPNDASASTAPLQSAPQETDKGAANCYTYWDSRTSPEDMQDMWNHPAVLKEWRKSAEKQGRVRFSHDSKKRPYLSCVEVKAIAEIILTKHFSTKGAKPAVLCAIAEVVSMRFVDGIEPRVGIMGMDYSIAFWLYMELGYRAYRLDSADDLTKPFVSMYFAATYLGWLSEYEGRQRTLQFVVQAYVMGPKNVPQETGPLWLKFEEAMSQYRANRGDQGQGSCSIM